MKNKNSLPSSHPTLRAARALTAAAFVGLLAAAAQGQIITRNGDGTNAFFASQSDVYQDSDPTGAIFGPAGLGPYTAGLVLPGLPAAPVASLTPTVGNPFAGGGWTSLFNDGLPVATYAAAQSTIDDIISSTPLVTSDVSIAIPAWRLFQAAGATGYAYEQINFGSNYLFTSNPGLGASTPALPIYINGSVVSGGGAYVQFDGVIAYTWMPVTINTAGIIAASGPSVALGQLNYTFNQIGGGTFIQTLLSTGSLLATPAGNGVLALDGHMWIAGDPFEMNVTTVPEPATLGLVMAGAVLVLSRRRSRASR